MGKCRHFVVFLCNLLTVVFLKLPVLDLLLHKNAVRLVGKAVYIRCLYEIITKMHSDYHAGSDESAW